MHAKTINGQLLAYRHRPSLGRTVVFANSLGSDQSIWDDVIAALPRGYGVLTFDLRGHGASSGATGFGIEDLADDAIGLIDALGLSDVLFCGISVGGMIGQVVAAKRPDLLSGVMLCNTAPKIGDADRWNTRIEAVRAGGMASVIDAIAELWFAPAYAAANPDAMSLHQNMLKRIDGDGYNAVCTAIRDADLTDTTSKITVPTLCLGGGLDKSVPKELVKAMADSIEGARYEELPGVGHIPSLEAPDAMVRLIEELDAPRAARFEQGMITRRAVLGDAHVDRAEAAKNSLDHAFQTLITEGAWGSVWSSPGISARERSMLTLSLLAATGNFEEIAMHVRATARTGATQRDIIEVFQHVAIYAGVPRANHALKIAKATLAEMKASGDA